MRNKIALAALLATSMVAGTARGQADGSFMTLDRMEASSRLGLQVSFQKFDYPLLQDEFGLRTEIHGQLMLGGGSGGVYGQLPLGHIISDGPDESALQNLDLGGVYVFRRPAQDLVLRAGLSLPTADTGAYNVLANELTAYERITDYAGVRPETMWFRLSASPILRSGNLVGRIDLGVDLKLDDDAVLRSPADVYLRANGGIAYLGAGMAFLAELVNIGRDGGGDFENRFAHTLAVGARTTGTTRFHFGFVLPLDEGPRGDLWIFSLGLQGVW